MPFPIRKITADERFQFLKTMGIPFGMDQTPGLQARFQLALEQADLCAAFDGDQMVSTFGAYHLNLTVPGGTAVPTAGTTVVTVLPTHRRQGILKSHMVEHFQEVHANGQPLAALWASETGIYGRFGYGPAAEFTRMTIPKPHAVLSEPVDIRGSMRLVEAEEALAVFPGIYDRVVKNRPGMFARTSEWWQVRNLSDPEDLRRGATSHRRVLYERDGQPAGYAIYRTLTDFTTRHTELILIELIGQDPPAERAIWQYVFGVDLITTITHWNLPVDDPLPWWVEKPREMQRKISDSIWVRPVDVIEALNRRSYSQGGRVVFRFRDEYCPWNEGTFNLDASQNGEGQCQKTASPPELELTPFTLGAVYLGGHRVGGLAKAGLITGTPDAIHQADAMFAWPSKPWCQEIF